MVNILDNRKKSKLVIKNEDNQYEKINPETIAELVIDEDAVNKDVQDHINDKTIHFTEEEIQNITKNKLDISNIREGKNITIQYNPETNDVFISAYDIETSNLITVDNIQPFDDSITIIKDEKTNDIKIKANTGGYGVSEWNKNTEYKLGQICTYQNCLFKYINEEFVPRVSFNLNDWEVVAGYQKNSQFYISESETYSIILEEEVASKDFLQINIDGNILQTNQYDLKDDGKTIIFKDVIQPNKSVNILTFGNYTIVNGSKIISKEFIVENGNTEFDVIDEVLDKSLTNININGKILLNSEWELIDGHIIKILTPLEDGQHVQISSWSDIDMNVSAIYTPHTTRENNYTILSWTNDGNLDNPPESYIYDGVTFTPVLTPVQNGYEISWTNDGNLDNPEPIIIYNGENAKGIIAKGVWNINNSYEYSEFVTYSDNTYQYGYLSKIDVPAGIELTNTEYWQECYRVSQIIVDTIPTENSNNAISSNAVYQAIITLQAEINKKIDSDNVYTKEEIDNKLETFNPLPDTLNNDGKVLTVENGTAEWDYIMLIKNWE